MLISRTPRVSIGLPVHNGAAYLGETLRDLLGQTVDGLEVVACDNASTDATPDLLADAAARDPRLRVVRNARNVGALANANRAFAHARGALYALAGHDDRHAPTFVERLVAALDADRGAVLAYSASALIGADGQAFHYHPDAEVWTDAAGHRYDYDRRLERVMPDSAVARYRAVLHSNNVNAPIHGLFRREALARVGPHRLHGSDRLVVSHASLLGRFAFVDAPLFGFRIHPGSTYHLTRAEWLAREAGHVGVGSPLDGARTLARYLRATAQAGLPTATQTAAAVATLGYPVRPAALRRALLPGPDNYWGWTGPGHLVHTRPGALPAAHRSETGKEWIWTTGEVRVSRNEGVGEGLENAAS